MKIAFIGQKGIPSTVGGVESHVENLAVGLHKRGHDVFVYCRPWYVPSGQKTYKGVRLLYKRSIRTKHLDTITHVWRASLDVLRRDLDVVHYHGVGPALLAWIPKWFKPTVRVVVTFHSIDRDHMKWGWVSRQFLRLGELFAVKFAHETIAVSKTLQRYVKKTYHEDIVYIPNGISKPPFGGTRVIKKKWGLTPDGYYFFMSRLVRHKGVHYLIDAYNKMKTDKKLVIAGGSAFTDDYVKEIKKKAGDNPNIIFTGSIVKDTPEWAALYTHAYAFVLPSESEGLPIVLLEAMSFGKCVITSSIPQNVEAISGGFGFQFKNKSIRSLKNKLQYVEDHPAVVKKIGAAAKVHVYEHYNWADIIKAIESLYVCLEVVDGERNVKTCLYRTVSPF